MSSEPDPKEKEEEVWKHFAGIALNGYIRNPANNDTRTLKINAAIDCADRLTAAFVLRYIKK